MTPKTKRATEIRDRVYTPTSEAFWIVQRLTADDVLDATPEVRYRMAEMADACEDFVKAWEGRAE